MTPDEAYEAIENHPTRVRLFSASDRTETVGEGVLVSYSIVPVVAIKTDDGQVMSWRHDLAEIIPNPPPLDEANAIHEGF